MLIFYIPLIFNYLQSVPRLTQLLNICVNLTQPFLIVITRLPYHTKFVNKYSILSPLYSVIWMVIGRSNLSSYRYPTLALSAVWLIIYLVAASKMSFTMVTMISVLICLSISILSKLYY